MIRRYRRCTAVMASLVILCADLLGFPRVAMSDTQDLPAAAEIMADINKHGARIEVAKLFSDKGPWNELMAKVGEGDEDWLTVAAALHPGTDAASAETLDQAVFMALKPAPTAVLRSLQQRRFKTAIVCSAIAGNDYSPSEARRLIRERIKVLSSLSDASLATTNAKCVKGLRSALRALAPASG